jgi:hypothetical protein
MRLRKLKTDENSSVLSSLACLENLSEVKIINNPVIKTKLDKMLFNNKALRALRL